MKKILLIIPCILICIAAFGQRIEVNLESPSLRSCNIYDLVVDGIPLNRIGNTCEFDMPDLEDGRTYKLEIQAHPNVGSINLSTFDLIIIFQMILGLNEPLLAAYVGDTDQDGAVSTYDIIQLRRIILFEEPNPQAVFHVLKSNAEIPEIDFLDIQVDYSSLEFTTEDFSSDVMKIDVLQLGNLDALLD